MGHDEIEYGVTEELESLIRLEPVLTVYSYEGPVGEGLIQEVGIVESVA